MLAIQSRRLIAKMSKKRADLTSAQGNTGARKSCDWPGLDA